jgi:hypothetical protein
MLSRAHKYASADAKAMAVEKPAGATVAGSDLRPLKDRAFARRTKSCKSSPVPYASFKLRDDYAGGNS